MTRADIMSGPELRFDGQARKATEPKARVERKNDYNRFVAFLHVLSWKSIVDQTPAGEWLASRLPRTSRELFRQLDTSWSEVARIRPDDIAAAERRYSQASNSFVFSYSAHGLANFMVLSDAATALRRLAQTGLFVRGAIACGPMVHEDNVFYGPAVSAAADVESSTATHPRIVIDPVAVNHFFNPSQADADPAVYIKRDTADGLYYVDWMRCPQGQDMAAVTAFYQSVRNHVVRNLDIYYRQPAIFAELCWLSDYFDQSVAARPECEIRPIDWRACLRSQRRSFA
jgi:hypothetical protein